DPMQAVEQDDDADDAASAAKERRRSRLNNGVAVMVAVLATFMGISKVKDDNIVQAMQQAQAKSVDAWAWYQAKKTRLQAAQATVDLCAIQTASAAPALRPAIAQKAAIYKKQVEKETKELADVQNQAKGYDADYDRL